MNGAGPRAISAPPEAPLRLSTYQEDGKIEAVFSASVPEEDKLYFPTDIQDLIRKQEQDFDYVEAATEHIALRREHPEILPMIVEEGVVLP
ncbi:MAG: hypothetical protein ACOYY3_07250 [Chloroflexota bacterium]